MDLADRFLSTRSVLQPESIGPAGVSLARPPDRRGAADRGGADRGGADRGGADRGAVDRGGAALLLQQVPEWSQRPAARRDAGDSLVSQTDEMTETQTAAPRSPAPSGWTPAPLLNPVLQNTCPSPEPSSPEDLPLS